MARTVIKTPYYCSFDEAKNVIADILTRKGYRLTTIKSGETVWKQGLGWWTGMKFVKVEFTQTEIILSAWISMGLGSFTMGEMDLEGMAGAIPKKQVKKVLDEIVARFPANPYPMNPYPY